MSAVGETSNELEFIRISSHIPKNIQEGSADIIFENNDILSHPKAVMGGHFSWLLSFKGAKGGTPPQKIFFFCQKLPNYNIFKVRKKIIMFCMQNIA